MRNGQTLPAGFSALRRKKEKRSLQVVTSHQPPSFAGPPRRKSASAGVLPAEARHTASSQLTAPEQRHTGMCAGAAERAATRSGSKFSPARPEDTGSGPN